MQAPKLLWQTTHPGQLRGLAARTPVAINEITIDEKFHGRCDTRLRSASDGFCDSSLRVRLIPSQFVEKLLFVVLTMYQSKDGEGLHP
jgi:hypothetical protein